MQMRIAVKIIITLIIILLILLTSLLIITKNIDEKTEDTTVETTANTEQNENTTIGDGDDTKNESTEDTDFLTSDTDAKPEDTTAADTASPPDTEPSVNTEPLGFTFNETLKSDTGTRLNIRVDLRGENAENGKVKLTAVMYLEYYSIGIGDRSGCRLSVGDASKVFHTEKINETEEKQHTKYLCEVQKICDYGETVSVSARFPFRGVYSGVEIEYLEIDSSVTLK